MDKKAFLAGYMEKKSTFLPAASALGVPIGAIIGAIKANPGQRLAGASYGGLQGGLTGLGADLAGAAAYHETEGMTPEARLGILAGSGGLGGYGSYKLSDLLLPYLYEKGELEKIFGRQNNE